MLGTGTSKHQCVNMRTKDFKECLSFKKELCALRHLWKGLFSGIKPTVGLGPNSNYLKNTDWKQKVFQMWLSWFIKKKKKKYLQKEYKSLSGFNTNWAYSLHFSNIWFIFLAPLYICFINFKMSILPSEQIISNYIFLKKNLT